MICVNRGTNIYLFFSDQLDICFAITCIWLLKRSDRLTLVRSAKNIIKSDICRHLNNKINTKIIRVIFNKYTAWLFFVHVLK